MRENIWKNIKLGFKTNKLAVAGAAAIILLALISIFAFLYPVDPNAISATERLNAPSMAHLFGTDDMGRDYLARCIYGGRASLLVGFLSMVLSTALGVIIGSISGFVGGTVDAVLMRLVDALMSLPTFLIMIVMNAFLKPGLQNIVLIIGFLTWMNIARIVRGETISLNEREYVIYAKISGQKKFSTIVHHILPNIMPTIIVAATMNIANAILMESALSFFGLGIQPPTASWGKYAEQCTALYPAGTVSGYFPRNPDPDHGRQLQLSGRSIKKSIRAQVRRTFTYGKITGSKRSEGVFLYRPWRDTGSKRCRLCHR